MVGSGKSLAAVEGRVLSRVEGTDLSSASGPRPVLGDVAGTLDVLCQTVQRRRSGRQADGQAFQPPAAKKLPPGLANRPNSCDAFVYRACPGLRFKSNANSRIKTH